MGGVQCPAHAPSIYRLGDLHSRDDLPGTTEDIEARPREYFEAMVEALDTEIGRLITSIDSADYNNTVVIVVGDNGTAPQVAPGSERGRSKGSIYEGGIHVPLIVSGPGVGAGRTDALVNLVDVFPTILELMGADPVADIDGLSFAHVLSGGQSSRTTLYSEVFGSTVLAGTAGSTVFRWPVEIHSFRKRVRRAIRPCGRSRMSETTLLPRQKNRSPRRLAELRSRLARIAG